jgi:NADPH2:quinone reductase
MCNKYSTILRWLKSFILSLHTTLLEGQLRRKRENMKAIRVHHAGGPDVLQIEDIPRPLPRSGWVLIHVKAFGLNRSELFTRQGSSPSVQFPRVLGIECVGTIEDASDTDFSRGQTVAALMGEMGRAYDGSYAEYTLVPAQQVIPLDTHLPWETLAALPETFLTAWGSLQAIGIESGQILLLRGATSALGMVALSLARDRGVLVIAATRTPAKVTTLEQSGAMHVVIDDGQIAAQVRQLVPGGVQGALELVGVTTLRDSLQAVAAYGVVCNTGILGNSWVLDHFEPLVDIPSTVKLTVYTSDRINRASVGTALQHIVEGVEQKRYDPHIDHVFSFDQIVEAHRYMEENRAKGKLVVLVD